MLHYLDFIKYIIEVLKKINNNDLIKYLMVALILFYFIQGIDIGQFISFGFIFILVVSFLQGDFNILEKTNPEIEKEIKKIETKIEKPYQEITSGNNNIIKAKAPNMAKLPKELSNLTAYIINLKKTTKDPTYQPIIRNLQKLSKKFVKEIQNLFHSTINNQDYPHHNYNNVRELEKEISILLQSLYFKVENNQDMVVGQLIHNIENEMETINHQLENYVNTDFANNTNTFKGPILKSQYPKSFDEMYDVNNRFLP